MPATSSTALGQLLLVPIWLVGFAMTTMLWWRSRRQQAGQHADAPSSSAGVVGGIALLVAEAHAA